ncbi:3'-5' exoribonuclease HELZ2-like [Montipora foliosa]|uniref:3'-5' exoribonuclease HELZ2-like n=1 Tax=Montipora foliosa TaxID=591990 RepID=UPI0035F1EDCA
MSDERRLTTQRSSRNHQEERLTSQEFAEAEEYPTFLFITHLGKLSFESGNFDNAIAHFSKALDVLDNISNEARAFDCRWPRVRTLLSRAVSFNRVGLLEQSIEDCREAIDCSREIGFENGSRTGVQVMMEAMISYERAGDIGSAFKLAVSLKTLDFKEVKSHLYRLREKLNHFFECSANRALSEGLLLELMSSGTELFCKERYAEAAEYFTEVKRLAPGLQIKVPLKAHLHLAMCFEKRNDYDNAIESCRAVLDQDSENEDAMEILARLNAITQENGIKKFKKKKKRNKKTSSPTPSQEPVPVDKKPPMNKKQRKMEEQRQRKEQEKTNKEIMDKIGKDTERQQQLQAKKKDELEAKNLFPTLDAKTAFEASGCPSRKKSDQEAVNRVVNFGGARPKQRQTSTASYQSVKDDFREQRLEGAVAVNFDGARPKQRQTSTASNSVKDDPGERRLGGGNTTTARNKKDEIVKDRGSRQSHSLSSLVSLRSKGHSTGEELSLRDRSSSCSSSKQTAAAPKETEHSWTLVSSRNSTNPKSKQDESPNKSRKANEQFDFTCQRGKVERFERFSNVEGTSRFQRSSTSEIVYRPFGITGQEDETLNGNPKMEAASNSKSTSCTLDKLPKGVVRVCEHFVHTNKTPSKPPYSCLSCSRQSKFLHGIWQNSKKKWQVMRPYPREVSLETPFEICWRYRRGEKCGQSCTFAHGEEELTTWTTQRQSDRCSIGKRRPTTSQMQAGYNHEVHSRPCHNIRGSLIIHDTRQARPRSPPIGVYDGNFQLCKWWKSARVCKTGRFCTFAHGQEELRSWKEGHKKSNSENALPIRMQEPTSQRRERTADISEKEMVYSLPGVQVSSDKPPTVQIIPRDQRGDKYEWTVTLEFEIRDVGMLKRVDLTHRYHNCYRLTRVSGCLNGTCGVFVEPYERWSCTLPDHGVTSGKAKIEVSVLFENQISTLNRTFTQCLRFDFGKKPYLLYGFNVDVARKDALDTISATREELKLDPEVWTETSVEVAVSSRIAASVEERTYQLPSRIENVVSAQVVEVSLTEENYQRAMHQLLFTEELFMKKAISRFILRCVPLQTQKSVLGKRSEVIFAEQGELFGVLTFEENGAPQPDYAAGRLLIRNIQTAWLRLASSNSSKVCEALVQTVDITGKTVVLKLSSRICSELQLNNDGGKILVDVQFQLNRQPLCEWHAAIDKLGPTQRNLLFPKPSTWQVTHEEYKFSDRVPLDEGQRDVVSRILSTECNPRPLVVFGPFGTGKTFTLHQAIRELVRRSITRILLCTHTNSAADLHVELLDNYLTNDNGLRAAKPLRIYHVERRLDADSKVAKNYTLIENGTYKLPTREDVIDHRVVITTLGMSKHLLDLQLNRGFFTHILVDEAAQALEPEALTPLVLAGPNTKIVLTGDHMQMKPEVYSHFARDWGLQCSLPERLFDHYYQMKPEVYRENVMFLTKNYRCHPEILQFPSDNFYGEGLIPCSTEAAHPRLKPLMFFSVCGLEEARDNSYVNSAEASEIVKRVKELSDDWPVEWGEKELSKIGVISASSAQVKIIRMLLRRNDAELGRVTVESIYNIQGKEFRAVFISTVRTFLTCQIANGGSGSDHYWEFLSDATLLNTAITRAKSLVAVVGEPVSLCIVGECRGNWRDYIRRCADRESLYGISYEELRQQVDASLRGISLNPQAASFVPKGMAEVGKEVCKPIDEYVNRQDEENENPKGREKSKDRKHEISDFPTGEETMEKESSEDEDELDEESESEGDDPSIRDDTTYQAERQNVTLSQDTSENWDTPNFFHKFRREHFEDASVFPRYMDEIIKALVEKCAEIKGRDAEYPSLETAKRISGGKTSKAFSGDLSSVGYQFSHINGRKVAFLDDDQENTKSSRTQRLTALAPSRQNDYLDAEILEDLLRKQPDIYITCNLRLGSESFRSAYGVVSDTKTPDIKVKGRIRGVFDMDRVVIKKKGSSKVFEPCPQGEIVGVLNHIISPHERQYVCRVDPENPECILPINKSVPRIVTLRAKDVNGMPIYKKMRDGDDDKLRVDVMGFEKFCSGKYLFLVQYLQWRSDCSSPLGIIIGKLPQINTLEASMEILFAEHGIRKPFNEESKLEVRRKFPKNWSVPDEEYQTRQKIEGAFTIDPETSKDLDDALTVEKIEGSVCRIGVHIADVSFFVEEGTALDKDAFFRCTSYYPGHDYESVPMLPPELSENHCSLLPDMDRLSVSVFLDLSDEGELVAEPKIERTIVRSCCRLSYGDAQKIIDGQDCFTQQIPFNTAENIRLLSFLAQRRRLLRLRGASFDHWSNCDHDPENFKAHEMVQEMMILANQQVANRLFTEFPDVTPLRVQLPPKEHRLKEWTEKYGKYVKYSLLIRGFYSEETLKKMTKDIKVSEATEFKVQQSVWHEICDAEKANDQARLQFLICNESHHPQLVVANCEFRRLQPKAQYACSEDQRQENNVHFSMGMSHYTNFTSPIRRYIDIQGHRILLGLIQGSHGSEKVSKDQVGKVCRRSTFAQENSRKFDKGCKKVQVAAKLKVRSQKTKAVLSLIEDHSICLEILDQEYNQLSGNQRRIKLSSLKPFDRGVNKDLTEIKFTWKQRLYVAPKKGSRDGSQRKSEKDEVKNLLVNGMGEKEDVLDLPGRNWLQILRAVQEGNSKELGKLIRKTDADCMMRQRAQQRGFNPKTAETKDNMDFFYDMRLVFRRFDVINVQLTAQMNRGVLHPEVQLFMVNPNFHICIEHQNYPKDCFATTSRSKASRKKYSSVEQYIRAWEPVLAMEAATGAVEESDEFTIFNLELHWTKHSEAEIEVSFRLPEEYCAAGQIEFYDGDFVCVRVCKDQCVTHTEHLIGGPQSSSDVLKHEPALRAPKNYYYRESSDNFSSFWVGHCIIRNVSKSKNEPDTLEVKMDLHQSSSDFPEGLVTGGGKCCMINVIHRSIPHRRMLSALKHGLLKASQLVQSICMGSDPPQGNFDNPPSSSLSIVKKHPFCGLKPLNQYQEKAVRDALTKPFTLVQGPPGTGKTVTGVHIAYWFTKRNMQLRAQVGECNDLAVDSNSSQHTKRLAPPQVIYCGPSNKSVDVVAHKMLKIPGIKILRVYGDVKEQAEFPIPNKRKPLRISTEDDAQEIDEELKAVSLHHVIRRDGCPFAGQLRELERGFNDDRMNGVKTSNSKVEEYRTLIGEAEKWALQRVHIVLCTCAAAGGPRIATSCNIQQCIVDECGMCLEPESLVPMACSGARQVVLIGDHKQLQPVIQDQVAKTLGLSVSMFERLSGKALMLELQYRMHDKICRFPSTYFYGKKLKTDRSVPNSVPLQSFWPENSSPMAFCHVEGEEEASAIKTSQSNAHSKANMKEVRKVVQVARLFARKGVRPADVVILTPYREQQNRISTALRKEGMCKNILVTTIVKSQGSEWDYVILSLVRSGKTDDLDPEPSKHWLREHLGFLTDEHQMNVGLTRARKGLCIIGNKHLLKHHPMWEKLLTFYEEKKCLVEESHWPKN